MDSIASFRPQRRVAPNPNSAGAPPSFLLPPPGSPPASRKE
jgi:hypothetical protein